MSDYHPDIIRVRRLGRLMLILTGLLIVVLALYTWPIISAWFHPPSANPRPITPRGPLMAFEDVSTQVFKKASPSVCFITTETRRLNPFSRRVTEVPQGSGSGFVWDEAGLIVTNYHVVQNASSAHVILYDQSTYDAKVVGYSPDHDLAVLRIN